MSTSPKQFVNPQYLVETDWLEAHLDDPGIRIMDATVYLPNYFDESAAVKVEIVSGIEDYKKAHIPGAIFADQLETLAGPKSPRFMAPMPTPEAFAEAMGNYGVSNNHHVILYDNMVNIYATRLWWLFRVFGFDNVSVLNGGWKKWTMEDRPVSSDIPSYPKTTFAVHHRPHLVITKEEVQAATNAPNTCVVNALDPEEYAGRGPNRYGRQGHIPGTQNVSFLDVLNMEDTTYKSAPELYNLFADAGVNDQDRVITYCGGAIAATSDALVLALLGRSDIGVYEGSMTEWAADNSLPIEAE